jgi:hypothetical protein
VTYGDRGLTVELFAGPPLIFGTPAHAAAKWAAAARVMADASSAGATYLDLREPGRVAAGGLGPVVAEDPQGDAEALPATPSPGAASSAGPAPSPAPTATAPPYPQP